jgi:hypothetical protein
MRTVAVGTAPLGNRLVYEGSSSHIIVTLLAKLIGGRFQQSPASGAVRVVTCHAAVILDDGVKLPLLGGVVVTVGTQGRRFLNQKVPVFRGMGAVTIGASASSGGLMENLFGHHIVMALQA